MKMNLDLLRERCKELLKSDKDKYTVIYNILKEDDCFKRMSMDMAYSILRDLRVDNKEEVYIELMKR